MFTVADEPNYSRPLLVNPDFSRLTANRTIPKIRAGTVSFVDMERLEKCFRSLLEGNSHALWLMSGLLPQLKADGFSPSDPSLFDKTISSISSTLASQTSLAAAMAEFMVTKRRESLLSHVSLPLTAAQKQELLVTPGQDSSLFDQSLLERMSGQVKEDSFISTSMAMAKLVGAKPGSKAKVSSSSASSSVGVGSSPLDFSQPGPSGAPIWCSPPSTSGIYNLSTKACVPWVHSWVRVNRLGSSRLCLLCAGGGGDPSGLFPSACHAALCLTPVLLVCLPYGLQHQSQCFLFFCIPGILFCSTIIICVYYCTFCCSLLPFVLVLGCCCEGGLLTGWGTWRCCCMSLLPCLAAVSAGLHALVSWLFCL